MAPTQKHRWLTRAANREDLRIANLRQFALDTAGDAFEREHPGPFAPVVALMAAYEAEATIGDVLAAMPDRVGGMTVTPLVVVDGGTDGTADVARAAGVATCVLPVNLGQGAALRLGYRLASDHGARYVVTLDADGQNDPAEMDRLVAPLVDGTADMVIASRQLGEDHTTDRFRRAGVALYARTLNLLTGQHLTDTSNGYRAFRVEVVQDIVPLLRQDQYQTAEVVITVASRGWRIGEVPITWHPRASGASKKGGNLFFGLQYARVIATTWGRVALAGGRRR